MKNKVLKYFSATICIAIVVSLMPGCDKKDNDDDSDNVASCEGCHTNYAHLQEVYTPDTAAPVGGCGGEAPHYEPYDRVYMGGDGYEAYKTSGHYELGCVACHNGVDNTEDKATAHSGNFIAHPSSQADDKCASCHQESHCTQCHQMVSPHGTEFRSRCGALRSANPQLCTRCHDQETLEMISDRCR